MGELRLRRLKMLMEPEPGNPLEVEGVLNPAAARGPDGALYLFPRLVGPHNYSRIGIARVRFDDAGDPAGVERLGVALEPEADYERRPDGGGGCEDPRVTFIEPLHRYVMTYTAFSARGPRVALAERDGLRGGRARALRAVHQSSPAGESGIAMGASQDRRWRTASPDPEQLPGEGAPADEKS
jgi:beta-1,2-mannobiose phosphorylase / 1,2-beta-oligomannan phosphorylase